MVIKNNEQYRVELTSGIYTKEKLLQKKTLTKYCHRWLSAGEKNFGQPLACPHYHKTEDKEMYHEHFLQCKSFENRKILRLQHCKSHILRYKTPSRLTEEILEGIWKFYDNNMDKKTKDETQKTFKDQQNIGWDHFCRGRIC